MNLSLTEDQIAIVRHSHIDKACDALIYAAIDKYREMLPFLDTTAPEDALRPQIAAMLPKVAIEMKQIVESLDLPESRVAALLCFLLASASPLFEKTFIELKALKANA